MKSKKPSSRRLVRPRVRPVLVARICGKVQVVQHPPRAQRALLHALPQVGRKRHTLFIHRRHAPVKLGGDKGERAVRLHALRHELHPAQGRAERDPRDGLLLRHHDVKLAEHPGPRQLATHHGLPRVLQTHQHDARLAPPARHVRVGAVHRHRVRALQPGVHQGSDKLGNDRRGRESHEVFRQPRGEHDDGKGVGHLRHDVRGLVDDGERSRAAQPAGTEPAGRVRGAVGEVRHDARADQVPSRIVGSPSIPTNVDERDVPEALRPSPPGDRDEVLA
mmetsp:Transcript_10714/g.46393  ORF Transcript_10714/g.46393 Transcript_10714/m.46393 type:complete len:277 (+) Transcript_10714:1355-2185(+)